MTDTAELVTFEPWPKIPRYNRNIVITEKIDGTNAAVLIARVDVSNYDRLLVENFDDRGQPLPSSKLLAAFRRTATADEPDQTFLIYAQSRTRLITPADDNFGFAKWVQENAGALLKVLGEGRHFGEWWGAGIQRRYGLSEKRFSLFNARRWLDADLGSVPGLGTVPILYEGPMSEAAINETVTALRIYGSSAAVGFDRPEGIVVWHDASQSSFKITLEKDEAPKGVEGHKRNREVGQ